MVSEISGSGSIKSFGTPAAGIDQAAKAPAPKTPAGGAPDNVTLTDLATRLQVLTKSIEHLPAVDRQRVAEFAQLIADGAYHPAPQEIADKIAAIERQLVQLPPSA
jgi:flagellar biosynthesis anti-sigma factor FlgM